MSKESTDLSKPCGGGLIAEAHVRLSCDSEALLRALSERLHDSLEKMESRLTQEIRSSKISANSRFFVRSSSPADKEEKVDATKSSITSEVSTMATKVPRDRDIPQINFIKVDEDSDSDGLELDHTRSNTRKKTDYTVCTDGSATIESSEIARRPSDGDRPKIEPTASLMSKASHRKSSPYTFEDGKNAPATLGSLEKMLTDMVTKTRSVAKVASVPFDSDTFSFKARDNMEFESERSHGKTAYLSKQTSDSSLVCKRGTMKVSSFTPVTPSSIDPTTSVTLKSMRQSRQDELLTKAMSHYGSEGAILDAPLWLCLTGILPYGYRWNQLAILALLVSVIAFYTHQLFRLQNEECGMAVCREDTFAPILALTLGCFIRLFWLIVLKDHVVGTSDALLTHYLHELGVMDAWILQSQRDMIKMMVCWCCMLGAWIYVASGWVIDAVTVLHIVAFACTSHVFIALAFSMLYVCQGLFLGIDRFCSKIIENEDCENAVEDWNIFQAILRGACIPVARSFIIALTSSLAVTFLPTAYSTSVVTMLPGVLLLFVILWVSLFIGDVTAKCERVATFINMLDFGEKIDAKRQYVVHYIINSRAGFYMFDVRVTAEMVVKGAYIGIVAAAAVATRALSTS